MGAPHGVRKVTDQPLSERLRALAAGECPVILTDYEDEDDCSCGWSAVRALATDAARLEQERNAAVAAVERVRARCEERRGVGLPDDYPGAERTTAVAVNVERRAILAALDTAAPTEKEGA